MKNEHDHEDERLFVGLEPPPPPADLRARTQAAAREAMARPSAPDVWSRIWHHRGLRLAWAAAVVLLLAGHVLVNPDLGTVFSPKPPVQAVMQVDEEFAEIVRPIQIRADAHPTLGLFGDTAELIRIEYGGNPS